MILKVGNRKIKAFSAVESEKPTRDGLLETLQIITEQPLTPSEIKALQEGHIEAEDDRVFEGYSEVDSQSLLLYRPSEATRRRAEEARQVDTMRAMVADMPDDLAKKYADLVPSMRFDGGTILKGQRINWGGTLKRAKKELLDIAECAPNVKPLLWEEV